MISLGVANLANASTSRARPDGGARSSVRRCVGAVKVEDNARIGIFVGAREGNTRRKGSGARRSYTDLNAAHIELNATGRVLIIPRVSLMESNQFGSKKIISGRDVWDCDSVLSTGGNEFIDTPLAATVSILEQLHPDIAGAVRRGRSNVNQDGAFVRRCNDIIIPVVVIPFKGNLVAALDIKSGGNCAVVDVASHGRRIDVFDGIVIGRATDVLVASVSLEGSVDPDTVDSGVSVSGSSKSGKHSSDGKLHFFLIYKGEWV